LKTRFQTKDLLVWIGRYMFIGSLDSQPVALKQKGNQAFTSAGS